MLVTSNKDELVFKLQNPKLNWLLQNYKNEFLPDFIEYYNPYLKEYLNPGEV